MTSGDPEVYDKAAWHLGGEWPAGLPAEQAYVHAGLLFGWMIERGLTSARFRSTSRSWSTRSASAGRPGRRCIAWRGASSRATC